jgi:hypothetical protein
MHASCDWWGLWNIICSFAPLLPCLGFACVAQTWVLSLCSSFPPLPGALFNGACYGFIITYDHIRLFFCKETISQPI